MPSLHTEPALRKRALLANSTDTSFAALAELVGNIPSALGGELHNVAGKNQIIVWPFGVGADDITFSMRIVGSWKGELSWGQSVLFSCTNVCSTAVGVAGGDVLATDRYSDSITLVDGAAENIINTTTANTPALALVDMLGAQYIHFQFNMTGATSGNCMFAYL